MTNVGESEKGYTLSAFVQDDWRVSSRLNVNLGLRYDYQQPPYERNCGTSNFNPYGADPNTGLMGRMEYACKNYGKTYLNPQYTNFAPRVGMAYDLTGNGRTVIRAGYAIYYPSIFNLSYFGNLAGFGSTTTTYSSPGGNANLPALMLSQGFPTPPIQLLGLALWGPPRFWASGCQATISRLRKMPMSQQWGAFQCRSSYREAGWWT